MPGARFTAFAVTGIPEVTKGDDLAGLVLAALTALGEQLQDGDLVVVSSKVVSKAEGRTVEAATRQGAVDAETQRVVAERQTPRGVTRIVQSRSGPVLAAAGVDASNVPDGHVLLLPQDPDASAHRLLAALTERTGCRLGVVVTDTLGRPWRHGQVDAAIGAAGVRVGEDLGGLPDAGGRLLEVTHRALADEIASAADLVKGKVDGVPAAVLRGLGELVEADGPAAASLLRTAGEDWFRLGHAEAVRTALAVPPGSPDVAPQPLRPGDALDRLRRAVAVATASPLWPARPGRLPSWVQCFVADEATIDASMRAFGEAPPAAEEAAAAQEAAAGEAAMVMLVLEDGYTEHELVALGALAQRVVVAAWAEDLDAAVVPRWYVAPAVAVRAVAR